MLGDHRPEGRILLAEDDEDDYILIRDVLDEIGHAHSMEWVRDGEELMNRLHGANGEAPLPDLLLLDLNMPKKDGRTALREIRSDPALRLLPIVILTTSDSEHDVVTTYDLGANSYVIKPSSYEDFRRTMSKLVGYWFEVVNLPPNIAAPPAR